MENLYGIYHTPGTQSLDIVTHLVRTEQQNHYSACQVLQVTAQRHTHSNTSRSKQGSKTGRIHTQRTDYRDDKQNHHQHIQQAPEESLNRRLYLAPLHHVIHHPVHKRNQQLAHKKDDNSNQYALSRTDSQVNTLLDQLIQIFAVATHQLPGNLLRLLSRINCL